MPYEDIEQSEHDSQQAYLYLFNLPPDRILTWTNAPMTIPATIEGVEYDFKHPRGGIWHGSEGAPTSEDDRKEDPGVTESADSGKTGLDIHVSHLNPIIRAHRSFPPPGNTTVDIYRLNEVGGDPNPELIGFVVTECPIEESTGIIRCQHLLALVAGSEGLSETFGPTCPYMFGHFPCPVPIAAATDNSLVVEDIDLENETATLSGSIRIAGKYKPGVIIAPNTDKRSILEDIVDGSNHVITLQRNFPSTTLRVGDEVSVIRGCDRLHQTCRDEWGEFTGDGAAFGGNNLQANKNPHEQGRLE
jgi:hypothetical protein